MREVISMQSGGASACKEGSCSVPAREESQDRGQQQQSCGLAEQRAKFVERAHTLRAHVSVRSRVERLASAARRQHPRLRGDQRAHTPYQASTYQFGRVRRELLTEEQRELLEHMPRSVRHLAADFLTIH